VPAVGINFFFLRYENPQIKLPTSTMIPITIAMPIMIPVPTDGLSLLLFVIVSVWVASIVDTEKKDKVK